MIKIVNFCFLCLVSFILITGCSTAADEETGSSDTEADSGSDSDSDEEAAYTFSLYNASEACIWSIYIDGEYYAQVVCPGQTVTKEYDEKPSQVHYTGYIDIATGGTLDYDVYHYPGTETSFTANMILDSNYFVILQRCDSTAYSFDMEKFKDGAYAFYDGGCPYYTPDDNFSYMGVFPVSGWAWTIRNALNTVTWSWSYSTSSLKVNSNGSKYIRFIGY